MPTHYVLDHNFPLYVADFAWPDLIRLGPKPARPIVYNLHIQTAPPAGAFVIMVLASITDAVDDAPSRYFNCSVEVEAAENKPGWYDAMKAMLVRECLAKWES